VTLKITCGLPKMFMTPVVVILAVTVADSVEFSVVDESMAASELVSPLMFCACSAESNLSTHVTQIAFINMRFIAQ
jgi:hypothetical protein